MKNARPQHLSQQLNRLLAMLAELKKIHKNSVWDDCQIINHEFYLLANELDILSLLSEQTENITTEKIPEKPFALDASS